MATTRTYLPAAGHDWFLPLYDPFVKLVGGDRAAERSSSKPRCDRVSAFSTSAVARAVWWC